jgi:GrpB-like predicted nucleotidyltransferase (UPF0157 family)
MQPFIEPASKPILEFRDWDPRYPEVVKSLIAAFGPPAHLEFEHVGSTAIPGCGGKGVLDVIALYPAGYLDAAKAFLQSVGFSRQGPEFSDPWPDERPMFLGYYRYQGVRFLVYVHVLDRASDEVRRFRDFKAFMIGNPPLLAEYCRTKRQIIRDGVTDTNEYAVRKRPFMRQVLGAAHPLKKP